MASFDTDAGEDVLALIRLVADPAGCEARLRELKAAQQRVAEAEQRLAKARDAYDRHVAEKTASIEKQMDQLARRLTAVADLDRRHASLAAPAARLRDSGLDPDFVPVDGSGLTRSRQPS